MHRETPSESEDRNPENGITTHPHSGFLAAPNIVQPCGELKTRISWCWHTPLLQYKEHRHPHGIRHNSIARARSPLLPAFNTSPAAGIKTVSKLRVLIVPIDDRQVGSTLTPSLSVFPLNLRAFRRRGTAESKPISALFVLDSMSVELGLALPTSTCRAYEVSDGGWYPTAAAIAVVKHLLNQ